MKLSLSKNYELINPNSLSSSQSHLSHPDRSRCKVQYDRLEQPISFVHPFSSCSNQSNLEKSSGGKFDWRFLHSYWQQLCPIWSLFWLYTLSGSNFVKLNRSLFLAYRSHVWRSQVTSSHVTSPFIWHEQIVHSLVYQFSFTSRSSPSNSPQLWVG